METTGATTRSLNLLSTTAVELRDLLNGGSFRSVDLVHRYLDQIQQHNKDGAALNALISTPPKETLLETAARLDRERSEGNTRGPLHGIPVIVKDNIWTSPSLGCATTCGTIALESAVAKENAPVIELLLEAGLIVIGKANLSEMAAMKGYNCSAGWSAVGGQTQSAYVVGKVEPGDTWLGHSTPGGSSSGSAVGVSAGFAPIAIGTETDGSILVPCDRAALYGLKATVGAISTKGVLPYTSFTDSLGPIAKSSEDIALMMNIMIKGKDFTKNLTKSWDSLRIGLLDPRAWASGPTACKPNDDYSSQAPSEIEEAMDRIEAAGAVVKRNIQLRRWSSEDNDMFNEVGWHDYATELEEFLRGYEGPSVQTMEDLVKYNSDHSARALPPEQPGQEVLTDAISHSVSDEKYAENRAALRKSNKDLGVDKILEEQGLDVIIGTPTGRFATVSAVSGYPMGCVPLGYARFNGRPFGLSILAPAHREDLIIRVMSAWEATFPARKPPPQLAGWGQEPQKSAI